MTLNLSDAGDGKTNLVMIHSGFDTEDGRDNHNKGWTSSLDCLEKFLASA